MECLWPQFSFLIGTNGTLKTKFGFKKLEEKGIHNAEGMLLRRDMPPVRRECNRINTFITPFQKKHWVEEVQKPCAIQLLERKCDG